MKRSAPTHVLAALRRSVCPEIGVEWDEEGCLWRFTYEGRPQSAALVHADGKPMLSLDGYADEIVRLAQAGDNFRDYGERRRRIQASAGRIRSAAKARRREALADLTPQARDRMRFERFGPRPFVTFL